MVLAVGCSGTKSGSSSTAAASTTSTGGAGAGSTTTTTSASNSSGTSGSHSASSGTTGTNASGTIGTSGTTGVNASGTVGTSGTSAGPGSTGTTAGPGSTGTTATNGSTGTTGVTTAGTSGSTGSSGTSAGDTCATAIALNVSGGSATVTGDTSTASSDDSFGCGGSGADLYYSLHLTQDQAVTITVTPSGTALDPVINLLANCAATDELSCFQAPNAGDVATLTSPHLGAGDYIISVDSYAGHEGPFSMTVTLSAPIPAPANDLCAGAIALTQGTPATGDLTAATNDYGPSDSSCGSTSTTSSAGPDLVYSFAPASSGRYQFTVTPNSGVNTRVYVTDSCAASITTCVGGGDNGLTGAADTLLVNLTQGTTYYVYVDSRAGASGTVTVQVDPGPAAPANDTCTGLAGAVLTEGNPVTGDLAAASNDYRASTDGGCGTNSGAGPDLVYQFTPSQTGVYTVTLDPGASSWDPVLYVLPTCGGATCVGGSDQGFTGDPESARLSLTGGTAYTVVVDAYGATGGTFTLSATAAPPAPANDTCTGAIALTEGSSVTGDTTSAINDYAPSGTSCPFSVSGPDVVYSFVPAATGTYEFTATPTGQWSPTLYVSDTCAGVTDCLAGTSGATGSPSTVRLSLTQGTTYYVFVDDTSTGGGAFGLSAAQYFPPVGDTCETIDETSSGHGISQVTLAASPDGGLYGSLNLDTTGYNNDTKSSSSGDCSGYGSGPDRVVRVAVPAAAASMTVHFTPSALADGGTSTFDSLVFVRNSPCVNSGDAGVDQEIGCNYPGDTGAPGDPALVTTPAVTAGDYFIWVDGFGGSAGAGTLEVTVP